MDFANANHMGYFETSAKSGENVKEAFETLFDGKPSYINSGLNCVIVIHHFYVDGCKKW